MSELIAYIAAVFQRLVDELAALRSLPPAPASSHAGELVSAYLWLAAAFVAFGVVLTLVSRGEEV